MLYLRISALIFAIVLVIGCTNEDKHSSGSEHHRQQYLVIATAEDPSSLDPRLVRDLSTVTTMHMLFEGLMRTNSDGNLEPAVAESYEISKDLETYTFKLRPCLWSDGSPVTAHDFEQTWKSVLAADFLSPNAYQLYIIKGAKMAKEGLIPSSEIGVKATSLNTLEVQLENPTPYFLEMISSYFYYPVHSLMRQQSSLFQSAHSGRLIGNGPFMISHMKPRNEIFLEKNPHYRDAKSVMLEGVILQVLDEHTALQLYKAGSLDWVGAPLSTLPQDSIAALKKEGTLQISTGAGTHWFRFNTLAPPFNHPKMRQAFNLALNRQEIFDHVTQGNQIPAIGIVPPAFGLGHQNYFIDHDIESARELFQEALADMKITRAELPKIALSYGANDRNHKIAQAVQQQWNQAFSINMNLESTELKVLFDKMHRGAYQINLGSWYGDFQDPINFLEIFKSSDNQTNQTFWQSPEYADLLDQSAKEKNSEKRLAILAEAEKALMASMPVAPLFHNSYNYLKTDRVAGVYFSSLGFLDFKEAELKNIDKDAAQ